MPRRSLAALAVVVLGCVEPLEDPERWLSPYARDAGSLGCDAPGLVLRSRVLCSSSLCHAGTNPAAELSFTEEDLSGLWGRPASTHEDAECGGMGLILDPAAPEESLLLAKLDAERVPCGEVMPVMQRLSEAEIACIRAWVLAQAPEAP